MPRGADSHSDWMAVPSPLACLPAAMTHASFGPDLRRELGITPDLVLLSIGIEDVEDLIEDVTQALDRASGG